MRPIRLALPLCLLLGPGLAVAQQHPIPVPPAVPPAPRPLAPPPPPRPEFVAVRNAAHEGERLVRAGRMDEAIVHFRRTVHAAPAGPEAFLLNSFHLRMLAMALIRAGRPEEADRELAWLIARAPAGEPSASAAAVLRLNDLRLYIQAGRGDVDQVLALLDARLAFRGHPNAGCPAGSHFPEVVAPAHHDPRVAGKLRALGCWQSIIDQLDEIASRPIGANMFDPGLPPRSRAAPR